MDLILTGIGGSPGEYRGKVRVVLDLKDLHKLQEGEILVAHEADPTWYLALFKAGGVIMDVGGVSSHIATICREFDIPCIVGARNATENLKSGETILIKVDKNEGKVYKI